MCKGNFAAYVNEKTPRLDVVAWLLGADYCGRTELWLSLFCWTGIQLCGIIK